jgi:hypothetical protein
MSEWLTWTMVAFYPETKLRLLVPSLNQGSQHVSRQGSRLARSQDLADGSIQFVRRRQSEDRDMWDAVEEDAVGRQVAVRALIERFLHADICSLGLALAPEARYLDVKFWRFVSWWLLLSFGHNSFLAGESAAS